MISFERPDPEGRFGSLELFLPTPGHIDQEAALEIFSPDTVLLPGEGLRAFQGGFGRLADLTEASFSWLRDGRTEAPSFYAAAFRLIVYDPEDGELGSTWELVWEPVYNGFPPGGPAIPVDEWVHSDVLEGRVWRTPIYLNGRLPAPDYCRTHLSECHRYDRGPKDWQLGPQTVVIGVNVAAGSGWSYGYRGFIDNVTLRFAADVAHEWSFEPMKLKSARFKRKAKRALRKWRRRHHQ